jgi:hypothetical protein
VYLVYGLIRLRLFGVDRFPYLLHRSLGGVAFVGVFGRTLLLLRENYS